MKYVLLWSKQLNQVLVKKLDDYLQDNLKRYGDNAEPDPFIPLLVGAIEEIEATAKNVQRTLAERAKAKA